MSLKINTTTYDIELTRGDSASIIVVLTDAEGDQIPFVDGQTVTLSVKKKSTDTTYELQKEITTFTLGKAVIALVPADTQDLTVCTYYYDVQWYKSATEVYTVLPASTDVTTLPKFIIGADITRSVEV